MKTKPKTIKPENAHQRAKNLIAHLHKIGQIKKMGDKGKDECLLGKDKHVKFKNKKTGTRACF